MLAEYQCQFLTIMKECSHPSLLLPRSPAFAYAMQSNTHKNGSKRTIGLKEDLKDWAIANYLIYKRS